MRLTLLLSRCRCRRTYLGHCGDVVTSFLRDAGAQRVLFVPWALKDWDKYFANPATIEYDAATGQPKDHTGRPQGRLRELGFDSSSIHHYADPVKAVQDAQARRGCRSVGGVRSRARLLAARALTPLCARAARCAGHLRGRWQRLPPAEGAVPARGPGGGASPPQQRSCSFACTRTCMLTHACMRRRSARAC
jgi:hypothetical protein